MARRVSIAPGSPATPGVTAWDDGINVAVVSENAERIEFCLFDEKGDKEVARFPLSERTDDAWSGFIAGLGPGTCYGLRADGPHEPERGHWFDPAKLLVDPYAKAIDRPFALHPELSAPRSAGIDTARFVPKAIVARENPAAEHVPRPIGSIYEIGVRAFTKNHPGVPVALRGTVAGLASPAVIDHLLTQGIDTVELMPLAAWIDERHLPALGLANAWGYNPVAFMAAEPRLAPGGTEEIRRTVAALHGAGIGVILDAVFNHTGESDTLGPTLSLRGLDNALYYRHAEEDPVRLVNDTGTGNTLAADRPAVMRLILDAMRHWAGTGIDGFRLDLAAVLGRVGSGGFSREAPLFTAIESDPALSRLTMIAEPWDVGPGGYQLGNFPPGWLEWNDRFRDDVRRFWRGDSGTLGTLATRLAGSPDFFAVRKPSAGVNFLAAHDGFALADVVAYETKHNEANGEQNRDGSDANFSWNNGVEGPTIDAPVTAARGRDVRALLATLFLSRGTPMLSAGDEFGRTQGGNNNAYAQDNGTTWIDWQGADEELAAFAARLAVLRKAHQSLSADEFLTGKPAERSTIADAAWLRAGGGEMTASDWNDGRRAVGLALYVPAIGDMAEDRTAIWINGGAEPATGWLPEPRPRGAWRRVLDTSQPYAADVRADVSPFAVPPRSILLFEEDGA